jgi:hypothetical protein
VGHIIGHSLGIKDAQTVYNALLIDDYTSGVTRLVTLNASARFIAENQTSASPYQIGAFKGELYILGASGIERYGMDLSPLSSIPLDEDYSKFIGVGSEILLLGYDKIDKVEETQ